MAESPSTRRLSGNSSTLWVLGDPNPVIYAVCRIGREIGHRMIAVGQGFGERSVLPDEPWVEGIEWQSTIPKGEKVQSPRAIIVAGDRVAAASLDVVTNSTRVVRVGGESDGASSAETADTVGGRTVILQTPPIFDDDGHLLDMPAGAVDTTHRPIPADQLAIALLRAALEPGHHGSLSPERVAELGDAMYIK